ncbi:leucine-rich repeat protein [Akkermansiaceae bacterium]|nr:leucine-rich repeat protein [Akkermansiaceae bacterium]MDB4447375.1 leucine-rich repeat protein [Akkermansiaceae bacterium]
MRYSKPSNTFFTSTIKNLLVMALAILAVGCDETGVDTVDIRSDESNTRNAYGKHQVTAVIQIHPTKPNFYTTNESFIANEIATINENFIANEIASLSLGVNLAAAALMGNWESQDIDPNNIQKNLVVTRISGTDMASITLHSDDPDQAKNIIEALISSYIHQRKTTEEDRAKKALKALDNEKRELSDLVQDYRKDLTVLIQQYGIPYFDGGSAGNRLGLSEQAMFQSARAKLADLETELALISAKNEALERDEVEQNKIIPQLEVLEKQVLKMREMVAARQEDAIRLSLKQTNYTQAKEQYEQARGMLREMKFKHSEATILLKMPRVLITVRQEPTVAESTNKDGGVISSKDFDSKSGEVNTKTPNALYADSQEESEAKKIESTNCINRLVISCDAFFERYQALPMATTSINDTEQATDNQLMATLVGKRSAEKENPKFLTFFRWKQAKAGNGGLIIRNGKMRLTDPWGTPYRVVFNYDNNNQLREPLEGKIISDQRVIAYSYGPDRMSGTPETNADNICSWRREETSSETKPPEAVSVNPNLKYKIEGDAVAITECDKKASGELIIPAIIEGKPVTKIGEAAFLRCSSLTSITIPKGVTSIEKRALVGCYRLTSINVELGSSNYKDVDGVLFNKEKTLLHTYPADKTGANYVIPNSVTSIGNEAFLRCTSLTSITIPDSVTSIGKNAFYGCSGLNALTFLGDAPKIENDAFEGSSPTIYREADSKGWGDTLAGRPVVEKGVDGLEKFDNAKLKKAIRKFVTAESPAQLKNYIRDSERVGPLLDRYYEKVDYEVEGFEALDMTQMRYNGDVVTMFVQKADFLSSPIAVERIVDGEEESYLIDWESWVGYCDYTPEQMRMEKPDKPFLMRVLVQPASYYNYEFSDDGKWRSLGLELKDSIYSFLGYVERDSEQDKRFRVMMKGGKVVACMVRVAYPTGSRSKDQVEILEIVGSGWLQNLKKDK